MLDIRNYATVTAAYWGFMLTDGALRMLVLLHFHTLGYTPFQLATLFLVYEFMGIVTNATGGWIASRFGLKFTLTSGLALQIAALLALSAMPPDWTVAASVVFVLLVQGVSGIAKDLTKMSSKSAIKLVVPDAAHSSLYKWVAILTGSKNAIKGAGFFVGGILLAAVGFQQALWLMSLGLGVILVGSVLAVDGRMGKSASKTKFTQILSKSRDINLLSSARVFLFGARDVWFVVGVPVFLYDQLEWTFAQVGGFMAAWVVGYGAVQALAPHLTRRSDDGQSAESQSAVIWGAVLCAVPIAMVGGVAVGLPPTFLIIGGLAVFGLVFAVNSALHSYLILAFSERDGVVINVGFYYMANAAGRLLGTLLSGIAYQTAGLVGCLSVAGVFLAFATMFMIALRNHVRQNTSPVSA